MAPSESQTKSSPQTRPTLAAKQQLSGRLVELGVAVVDAKQLAAESQSLTARQIEGRLIAWARGLKKQRSVPAMQDSAHPTNDRTSDARGAADAE